MSGWGDAMSDTKRILLLAPDMEAGGSERVFTTLLRHIDRSKFKPELALLQKKGPLLGEIPQDVPIHEIGATRARYALPGIIRTIRQRRPDVVMSILGHINLALMLCRPLLPRGTQLIARESNIVSRTLAKTQSSLPLGALYRWLYPFFDMVVCQSREMFEDFTSHHGLSADKAVTINNPVDVNMVRVKAQDGKSGLPDGVVNLVAAGSLTMQKGFDLLLDAFARLPREQFFLTILGEGPERASLEAAATRLGVSDEIDFRGYVDNPWAVMGAADIFVLSSRYEGFPNVVLESLACGTPVAAFGCPGGLNEIIRSGENGMLVEPEDVEGLATVIQSIIPFDRDGVVQDCKERFGVEVVIEQYEELLSRL